MMSNEKINEEQERRMNEQKDLETEQIRQQYETKKFA